MEKKPVPSKESIQDLKRIVDTLEQEKVSVGRHTELNPNNKQCEIK